jgi:ABC transport system ATP-binding/permease protein
LSGGERARLMLARILSRPSNLLVLDEPTNDLDMETLDLLQELVAGYEGTVILVSHDRDFLDRTVSSVIAPADLSAPDGRWTVFAGGFSDMMAQRKLSADAVKRATAEKKAATAGNRDKAQPVAVSSRKLSYKQKFALETLPKEIEKKQAEIAAIEARMAKPDYFTKQAEAFARDAKALETLRGDVERMEEEWLELEVLREEIEG